MNAPQAPGNPASLFAPPDIEMQRRADGAALLVRGHTPARPLVILAPNGLAHARFLFGAMTAAIPVTPQYALSAIGHAKLAKIADLVQPSAVLVDDPARFAAALEMLAAKGVPAIAAPAASAPALPALDSATPAKILFTSGS